MKRFLLVAVVVFVAVTSSMSTVSAGDSLKFRQTMGEGQLFCWYHNGKLWTSEMLFNGPNNWAMVGIGPRYLATVGPIAMNTFGYVALVQDLAKKHWPVKVVELETYIVPTFKKWTLHVRTLVDIDLRGEDIYIGRDFVGYQFSSVWEFRFQTEWKYQKSLNQSLGLGWEYDLTSLASLDGYYGIGIGTQYPHAKVGWVRLTAVFK